VVEVVVTILELVELVEGRQEVLEKQLITQAQKLLELQEEHKIRVVLFQEI
jgi:hypothetical protein